LTARLIFVSITGKQYWPSLLFSSRNFYKTNYIYGFGTTEDIPYGYNIAFTTGIYQQSYLSRPYAGLDVNRYVVYNKGDIVQYFLRAGSFWNKGKWQDAGILIGVSGYSRLFLYNNFKLRQHMQFSYTRQFQPHGALTHLASTMNSGCATSVQIR
jgi:hypothetical protein